MHNTQKVCETLWSHLETIYYQSDILNAEDPIYIEEFSSPTFTVIF